MATFITVFNLCIFALFTLCYAYQLFYVFAVFTRKPKRYIARTNHRYAVLISGRNESAVIGNLVRSLKAQSYPSELVDIFVVADNCTDTTAAVAADAGAIVFERFNKVEVGKSYALDYALKRIFDEYKDAAYEGFFVFDADNVIDEHFIAEMNAVFDNGARIVTSYRNSKNFDSSWISAGYALWFMREGKYLSQAREVLGTSCAISGTGFLISADILERDGGWTHHLLTEDIEFSVDSILHGERIAYAPRAILYDEQPITFSASWNQRLRWSRGFYQVFIHYGMDLVKNIFSRASFACYDMLMTLAPAMLLTLLSVIVNTTCMFIGFLDLSLTSVISRATGEALFFSFFNFYMMLLGFAILTTITEWDQIHAATSMKIKYMFTFPLFMFTYIPIAITALFKKVEWQPIAHTVVKSTQEIIGHASK